VRQCGGQIWTPIDKKNYVQALSTQLEAARARVETVRTHVAATKDAEGARGSNQLAAYEKAFAEENTRLAELKAELERLTSQQEREIRAIVESAPDHVPYGGGLLNRLTVLKQIADEKPWLTPVMLVLDLVAFGFELAGVLSKVTSYVPTVYAKLLAIRSYVAGYKMAHDLSELLADLDRHDSPPLQPTPPGNSESPPLDPFGAAPETPPSPPRRGRGRPRLHPLKNGSDLPIGKEGQNNDKPGEGGE
jgi:hypothetical protein